MRELDDDVVLVGRGPAGAAAAAAAAAERARVVAFDRRQTPGLPVQCAELVPGLIGQDAHWFHRARVQGVEAMATLVESEPADRLAPFPGHMIDRALFDREQVERAREAGAECYFGCPVRKIDPAGLVISEDGRCWRARVLIGADGPRSPVGRAVGRRNSALVMAQQVTLKAAGPSSTTDIFLSDRLIGGYGWLFPRGNVAHVGVGVVTAERRGIKQHLGELVERLMAAERVQGGVLSRTGGFIPVGGPLQGASVHGHCLVLLAGDAAGLANAVTGAGIHAALVSGQMAGETARSWLDGDNCAAEEYDDELDDVFGASLRRAALRRAQLMQVWRERKPDPVELRRGWIAYPEYWAA